MDTLSLTLSDTALTLSIGAQQHQLPIGIATLAKAFGQHMPNALALERAIADVEDAIMPVGHLLPAEGGVLHSPDPLLLDVIRRATADAQATQASREAIENLFEVLTRQATYPSHIDSQLTQTAEFAAALLIMRETLHHWGLSALQASSP